MHPEGADITTQLSGLWHCCVIPPLGQGLSDSEEHAHTVPYDASSHHLSPGNCPAAVHARHSLLKERGSWSQPERVYFWQHLSSLCTRQSRCEREGTQLPFIN